MTSGTAKKKEMSFRSDHENPNAPPAAFAGNVTYASGDRTESIIDGVALYVSAFEPDDPWEHSVMLEMRYIDGPDGKREKPPQNLLLHTDQAERLIESLIQAYTMLMSYRDKMN